MGSLLLGQSFTTIKKKLPAHEFNQYFKELTQVPMFNAQNFLNIDSEEQECLNG